MVSLFLTIVVLAVPVDLGPSRVDRAVPNTDIEDRILIELPQLDTNQHLQMREVPGDPRAVIRAFEWLGGQRYREVLLWGDGSTEPRNRSPKSRQSPEPTQSFRLSLIAPQQSVSLPRLGNESLHTSLAIQPSRRLLMPEQLAPIEPDLVVPGASSVIIHPKTASEEVDRP